MQITGIHHVTVVVQDLDRAARFYGDVLGLPEIPIPPTFLGAGVEVRWFQVGEAQQIHLLLGPNADAPSRRHVALRVDDAQAARAVLRARGVDVRETVSIPSADRFFVSDPDGNQIEVIEWFAAP